MIQTVREKNQSANHKETDVKLKIKGGILIGIFFIGRLKWFVGC